MRFKERLGEANARAAEITAANRSTRETGDGPSLRRLLGRRVTLPIWAIGTVALVLAAVVGAAASGSAAQDQDRAVAAEQRADDAERTAAAATDTAERAETRARFAEDDARKKLSAEYAGQEQALTHRTAELNTRADTLAKREQELAALTTGLKASTFGDGVWEVGRDIQPGKYRATEAGSRCYWEKQTHDEDIIANDNPGGPTTVTIAPNVPKFKSSNCGEWTKIG